MENSLDQTMRQHHFDRMNTLLECAIRREFPGIDNLNVDAEKGNISFTGGATKEDMEVFLVKIKRYSLHQDFNNLAITLQGNT